jgi:hypothetical protein
MAISLLVALVASGCSRATAPQPARLSPTQTLERFFTALNAGDIETVQALHSRRIPEEYRWNVKSVRLLRVEPAHNLGAQAGEIKARLGLADAAVLWAEFDIQFFREQSMVNGRHSWNYILIKQTPDGPWLIHDWGH